jgi:serine/threonine-protein kinase
MASETDAPIPATAPQIVPGTRLGKYEVIRQLGAGGMGAVYEAVHSQIGKRVAIKVLGSAVAAIPGARDRFLREAQLTSRVRHAHAVDVTDMGTEGDQTYIVMELLSGEDLATRLTRTGHVDARELVDILLPVCSAVASAHAAGVVHRDLKPPNIFLASSANGLTPKVLDFGISKLEDGVTLRALTSTGALIGTPYYLAPEQVVDSRASSVASDQFAIGVILYECLTGVRPFEGESLFVVFQAIVAGNPTPPRQLRPGLDPTLEAIVLRAMNTNPARRFPSVDELGRALWPFATERGRMLWQDAFGPGTGTGPDYAPVARTLVADSAADPSVRAALTPSARRPPSRETIMLPTTPVPARQTKTQLESESPSEVVWKPRRSLKPVVAVGAVVLLAVVGIVWVSQRGGRPETDRPRAETTAATRPAPPPPATDLTPPPRPIAAPPPDPPPETRAATVTPSAPPSRGASHASKRHPPSPSRTPPPPAEKPKRSPSGPRSLNPNAAPVIE